MEVEAKGRKNNVYLSQKIFTYISHREAYNRIGVNGTSYLVGLPAAIGARLILRKELRDVGLLFPESFHPPYSLKN